jgi:hypothetical protein
VNTQPHFALLLFLSDPHRCERFWRAKPPFEKKQLVR